MCGGGGVFTTPLLRTQVTRSRVLPSNATEQTNQPWPSVFQEPTTAHAHSVDPRDAWMLFVRQSDKGVNSKRRSRTKARRLKVSSYCPHQPPQHPCLQPQRPRKEPNAKPGSS